MKPIFVAFLAMLMLLTFVACGEKEDNNKNIESNNDISPITNIIQETKQAILDKLQNLVNSNNELISTLQGNITEYTAEISNLEKEISSALTLHVMVGTEFESGCVIIPPAGITAPSADYFEIKIKGKSCHGSAPQDGVDATLVSAHLLLGLEELISREIGGRGLAVLTVGRLNSGSAGNVISDLATIEGTLRTLDEEIRESLKKRLAELSKLLSKSFRASASVKFTSGCPSLLIDGEVSKRLQATTIKALGKERVIDFESLPQGGIGGSEDFAYISREIPSATFALCAGKRSDGYKYPLHHSKTSFDERALVYGAAVMLAFALEK